MISQRQLMRMAMIAYKKLQSSPSRTLKEALKDDIWWNSLNGVVHQKIGKIIAKYNTYFTRNCNVVVQRRYSFTDSHGNGIYA